MKNNGVSWTIIGLIIAALGVVAPIAWDWWNKRTDLTVEKKQSVTILQKEKSLQKLDILYAGKSIESLTKIRIAVRNAGRTPLTKDDVVSPLTLKFLDGEVLEISDIKENPDHLKVSLSPGNNKIEINFLLLNPGDSIEWSVLTSGSSGAFTADARIKNISSITLVSADAGIQIKASVGFTVYVVGVFSIMFFVVTILLIIDSVKERRIAEVMRSGVVPFSTATSVAELQSYINSSLSFLKGSQRQTLFQLATQFAFPLAPEHVVKLRAEILRIIDKNGSFGGAIISFLVTVAGFWYVASNFFIVKS